MSHPPPSCSALGPNCRSLKVTLRVSSVEEQGAAADHEATWLIGHTERITFLELWESDEDLYAEAILHVPCRHLATTGTRAECRAHGFRGKAPADRKRVPQPRRYGGDEFLVVDGLRLARRELKVPPRRLPVLAGQPVANPCESAPCRTSDHTRGAACCRDLQVEIMCSRRATLLEALVRHRQAPYLCKVERGGDWSVDVEMISRCDYLEPGGVACTLHGRVRDDGRPAKPDLCTTWPDDVGADQTLHTGCVFTPKGKKAS